MIEKEEKLINYINEASDCAENHGFHDREYSREYYEMLIITEVSEAIDADRHGRYSDACIFNGIKEQNKLHSIHDKKRPFLFNTEAIPGENVAIKMYNWDKADGYVVPKDQNLYNCYFYNPWDKNTSILDKLKLHGREINKSTDGGQACHLNLDTHLSKEQYLKLIDIAIADGTNYFTFNIPMSECADCGHVVNSPIKECPICGSKHIKYWTRIIGYLTCVDNWSKGRQIEFNKRNYSHE